VVGSGRIQKSQNIPVDDFIADGEVNLEKSEVRTYLRIYSTIKSATQIESAVGLKFSSRWNAGEEFQFPNRKSTMKMSDVRTHSNNGVIFEPPLYRGIDIEEAVSLLLDELNSHSENLVGISDSCDIQISCVVYWSLDYTPPLNFCGRTIKRMASIGASLDVDLYMFSEV
jgi:hypothetical protein